MSSSSTPRNKKTTDDNGVNVRVIVRCRPLTDDEKKENVAPVVSVSSERREVCVNQGTGSKKIEKKYTFDQVFGQYATQHEIFVNCIQPVVDEMLEGYNCTVFAYGQTGTGKTHTMEGKIDDPALMGVIPRAVHHIFEHLDNQNTEYAVRVSFLEMYNEELTDLLVPDDCLDVKSPRIFEDTRRGVVCSPLEELPVNNARQIFDVLQRGLAKRRVSETLLNKNSSRSHCIFTINVHIKETTSEGEEVLKIGKINLVDLAGSECIGRSGARENRAREAGNINKSLLTLGRVITSLVEHWGHVPYRDSKLTRLLQDSLGGRTKTCIIATFSPSSLCIEETMSTLEYAHRAKSIKNRPEVNQRMSKKALVKELNVEIEKLRVELEAQRAEKGVFLPLERYEELQKQCLGRAAQVEELEELMSLKEKEIDTLQQSFSEKCQQVEKITNTLDNTQAALRYTREDLEASHAQLSEVDSLLEESNVLLGNREKYSETLYSEAKQLQHTVEVCLKDINLLHEKIDRKMSIATYNTRVTESVQSETVDKIQQLTNALSSFSQRHIYRSQKLVTEIEQMKEDLFHDFSTIQSILDASSQSSMEIRSSFSEKCNQMQDFSLCHNKSMVEGAIKISQVWQLAGESCCESLDQSMKNVESMYHIQQEELSNLCDWMRQTIFGSCQELTCFLSDQHKSIQLMVEKLANTVEEKIQKLDDQTQLLQDYSQQEKETCREEMQEFKNSINVLLTDWLTRADSRREKSVAQITNGSQLIGRELRDAMQSVSQEAHCLSEKNEDFVKNQHQSLQNIERDSTSKMESLHKSTNEVVQHTKNATSNANSLLCISKQNSDEILKNVQSENYQAESKLNEMTRVKLENFDRIVDLVCSSTQQVSSIVQESTHKINASQEDLLINMSQEDKDVAAVIDQIDQGHSEISRCLQDFVANKLRAYKPTKRTPEKTKSRLYVETLTDIESQSAVLSDYRTQKKRRVDEQNENDPHLNNCPVQHFEKIHDSGNENLSKFVL